MSNWTTVSNSQYPWEQEALEFLSSHLPPESRVLGWSNFEYVADEGSIYEVDALVIGPWGAFLVEIKSRPGIVRGNGNSWTWKHEGAMTTRDNPVHLANRKAKSLISLLGRQKAFKKLRPPFLDVLVFLSHESNSIGLEGSDSYRVANRRTIIDAIRKRDCPGLREFSSPPVSTPQIRAFVKAMEQAGIRPLSSTRKAGDYKLNTLFWDCPTGAYQDWIGEHVTVKSGERLIRLYSLHRQASDDERKILQQAAEREYQIMTRLEHDGILRVDTLTSAELGPALVYRFEKDAKRLDHYLEEQADTLSIDEKLSLLRQIAEAIVYAHRKNVVHRALSPQSILVFPNEDDPKSPTLKIFNWQVGLHRNESTNSRLTRVSQTLHVDQLVEDSSTVYLAPELVSARSFEGWQLDIFSLGVIAYRIFSGQAPAANAVELNQKLSQSSGYLDVGSVLNSVHDCIVDLIQFSANIQRDLRYTAVEFLGALDKIEEDLTEPDEDEVVDPRRAGPNELLANGLLVKHSLGSGSTSKVYLVEHSDGHPNVLKVASDPKHNKRLQQEFETLNRLSLPSIVKAESFYEFGEVSGFTMSKAGDSTLTQRLRKDGKLEIELLERFGKDLLKTVEYLDQTGIAHRDIKPENLGVGLVKNRELSLILFDFSLSNAPYDQLQVGTPPYLDPFLENREQKRWDSYAERYAAAMTLYEMATGSTATYGDGESLPHLTDAELNIEADLFPLGIQEDMADFFQRALAPDFRDRHDNAEDMLLAWTDIFRDVDKPAVDPETLHPEQESVDQEELIEEAILETQLILLGLSTRLSNTLDRLGLVTVQDLLNYPFARIQRMRGVGSKTRQEAKDLVKRLRKRFPSTQETDIEQIEEAAEEENLTEVATIDLTVKQIMALGSKRKASRDQQTLRDYLGFEKSEDDPTALKWLSQSDFAKKENVSRAYIGQVVTKARDRWAKVPSLNSVRETIASILASQSGVMTHEELISSVLHLRGSALDDPERQRMASVVVRAAIETERRRKEPRFSEARRDGHIFIAVDPVYADFAYKLGSVADKLASEDPLPTSARSLEALKDIPFPDVADVQPPSASRLSQLAAASSQKAATNPRYEIYPKNLSAERALRLAQSSLFGAQKLEVESIRKRVASRFPHSEPLPDRPELDALLEGISLPHKWSPERRAYLLPERSSNGFTTGVSSLTRLQTRDVYRSNREVTQDEAEAQRLEEKLAYAHSKGSFLTLAVDGRHVIRAREELLRRFDLELISGDQLFLDAMRSVADKRRVKWDIVLTADATEKGSKDWERLQMLVELALPQIKQALQQTDKTILLTQAGLFARYERMNLIDTIHSTVGTPEGPHGLWILIPGQDKQPTLNGAAIPMTNPAQFEFLNEAWLRNAVVHAQETK